MNNLLNSRELFIGKQVRKISQSEFLIVGISGSVKKQKKKKKQHGNLQETTRRYWKAPNWQLYPLCFCVAGGLKLPEE